MNKKFAFSLSQIITSALLLGIGVWFGMGMSQKQNEIMWESHAKAPLENFQVILCALNDEHDQEKLDAFLKGFCAVDFDDFELENRSSSFKQFLDEKAIGYWNERKANRDGAVPTPTDR